MSEKGLRLTYPRSRTIISVRFSNQWLLLIRIVQNASGWPRLCSYIRGSVNKIFSNGLCDLQGVQIWMHFNNYSGILDIQNLNKSDAWTVTFARENIFGNLYTWTWMIYLVLFPCTRRLTFERWSILLGGLYVESFIAGLWKRPEGNSKPPLIEGRRLVSPIAWSSTEE